VQAGVAQVEAEDKPTRRSVAQAIATRRDVGRLTIRAAEIAARLV
jgi:hypothetical protein